VLRQARHDGPDFPPSVGNRGVELLYRVGDLKRRAHKRPRAASSTTDLDLPDLSGDALSVQGADGFV
jgi:hypothetical protein